MYTKANFCINLSLFFWMTQDIQAATLKVYNMSDRAMRGFTNPLSNCGNGKEECTLLPYQSMFHSNSVTFEAPDTAIIEFYFKGIIGPHYYIRVDLQQNEHATVELYGENAYKFKSKKMQYAQKI